MTGSISKQEDRYTLAVRVDTTDTDGRQLKRQYKLRKDAAAALKQITELVDLGSADDRMRRRIGDLIFSSRYGKPLPSVAEIRKRLGAGIDPASEMPTTGEFLDLWLAEVKGHLAPSTFADYRRHVQTFLTPHLGGVQLDRLNGTHIRGMLDWISARNELVRQAREAGEPVPSDPLDIRRRVAVTGLTTQRQILRTLCSALNTAVDDEHRLIDRNPAARIRLPQPERKPTTWWSSAEVGRFLQGARGDRLYALWRIALLRGPRKGELLALTWSDIDFDAKTLRIRSGKTKSSRRTVSLDAGTVTALRDHRKSQLEERLLTHGAYQDGGLVFALEDGSPIPPWWINTDFDQLTREADLPRMRFHDCRHSAASIALESSVDIKIVSDQLGHATTKITLDLYQHVARRLHDEAAERVAGSIDG
jgi:integrase